MDEVKVEVKNYFEKRFQESNSSRPNLAEVRFNQLFVEEIKALEVPFSLDEMK